MIVAAFVFLALQELPPEVAKQAARISAKDPRAALDAVSRLSDLAAGSRAAVEAAASKIPDEAGFYRACLRHELDARAALGERYPRLRRLSVDARDQTPHALLSELCARNGDRLELAFLMNGAPAPATGVTLKLDDVPFMEAVDAACREAKIGLFLNGSQLCIHPNQLPLGSCVFRNYLVLVSAATRSRRIEFGAGEKRSLRVAISLSSDSDGEVARFLKPELVEAVDGNGRRIAGLPEDPPAPEPPRKDDDPVLNVYGRWNQAELALEIPESDKVARLRGFLVVTQPKESSAFEFRDLEKDQKIADEHFEVQLARRAEGGTRVVLRVKPKGPLDAFLKQSAEIRVWAVDGTEISDYVQGSVSDGWVEYLVIDGSRGEEPQPKLKGLRFRVHRAVVERRVPFEFTDLPAK